MLSLLYILAGLLGGYGLLRFFNLKETLNTLINNNATDTKVLNLEAKRQALQAQADLEQMKRQYYEQLNKKGQDAPVSSSDFDDKPPVSS